jgi:hypothetical protein
MACLQGRATRPIFIDLGLVALTPQTGHCARAASQAFPSALLGKGWRGQGSLAVLRQQAKP